MKHPSKSERQRGIVMAIGTLLIGVGAGSIYWPMGLIAVGVLFVIDAYLSPGVNAP